MSASYPESSQYVPSAFPEGDAVSLEDLQARRAEFVNGLVQEGMISESLAQSGELDVFALDPKSGHDTLIHVLTGDKNGGAHHLPTAMRQVNPDHLVIAASRYTGSKSMTNNKLKQRQSVRENGTFRPKLVTINGREKAGGSAMFPNEWSTEQVIRAILQVSSAAPQSHDQERATYVHTGTVDGVDINVITKDNDGRIVTAFPQVPRK